MFTFIFLHDNRKLKKTAIMYAFGCTKYGKSVHSMEMLKIGKKSDKSVPLAALSLKNNQNQCQQHV